MLWYMRCGYIAAIIVVIAFLGSCLRLNPFLFNGRAVDQYRFDGYSGFVECASYGIQQGPYATDSLHQFNISSGTERIHGVFLSAEKPINETDTLILYLHGTSDHIDRYWQRTRLLKDCGYPTVVIDYRGYGLSTGESSEQGMYEDVRVTLDYIADSLGNPHVVLYGFSLGSIPAVEMAANNESERLIALILEAPIASMATIVAEGGYIALDPKAVTDYSAENHKKIARVNVPFLWLYATEDETLAWDRHGMLIWQNYQGPRAVRVAANGAGHREVPQTLDPSYSRYKQAVADFIQGRFSNALFSHE